MVSLSFYFGGLVCVFFFLLCVLGCYLYTPCVLCVPFLSAFNIFALFTYTKNILFFFLVQNCNII